MDLGDPNHHGAAGQVDSDDADKARPDYGFKPSDGERMFLKESGSYKDNMPFNSYLCLFSHLADLCTVHPKMYKSTLYMKVSGLVGALVNDMVPD